MDTKTATPNLDELTEFLYRYTHSRMEDKYFCPHRLQHALTFSSSGLFRLGSIVGWLVGLSQGSEKHKAFAESAAKELFQRLEYLRDYGGTKEVIRSYSGNDEVSNYQIELVDDGCLHSFGIVWHKLVDEPKLDEKEYIDLSIYGRCGDKHYYKYSHNGAMIYHGAGSGETFSVHIGSSLWGIHT